MRNISIDLLRIFLAFMVVGIHTNILAETSELGAYLLNQGLSRIAVPIFFIVSGYYYFFALDSDRSRVWITKISVLYAVWMTIYSYYWISLNDLTFLEAARNIHTVIFGYFHLWYLPATLCAAIAVYFIRDLSKVLLIVLLVCAFGFGVLIQYLGNYHLIDNAFVDRVVNMGWLYRNFLFFGLPFFLMGYLLARTGFESKVAMRQIFLIFIVGLFFVFFEAYINYSLIGKSENFDLLISLIILSPSIFLLAQKSRVFNRGKSFSQLASGIYFIHPLCMYFFWDYGYRSTPLAAVVLLASIPLAFALIHVNKKAKFLL